ncbi:MAG: bifunctional demethylmenaquinone methyltransferase/2-methoxy-6-polyprenyl-1,4-benzoquinol methylase UbiE [Campylobacterota bacterium]|nr:bifunctional demethylmenaquinone methyltransferase/2-methoxy-6-polyprenyl-1,4-benzoquinol methylase UbiE [Campylobacterota bacterium]
MAEENRDNQEDIIKMFNDIAKTYDLANRVLSMGVDKTWRKKACNMAFNFYGKAHITRIVDVACGTGDLMVDWENIVLTNGISIDEIIGVDPSVGMMEVGKTKIPHRKNSFIEAGAESMPLEDESADFISISYGIRNVVKRKEGLLEFARVLKKGGLCIILEFTKNDKDNISSKLTKFYMNNMMPHIGGLVSKNKDAYTYLPESIENFITTKQMCEELKEVGLEPIFVKGYSLDISTTFIARKI